MAKVTIPTDEKKFKKFVKACGKEMQLIVNPTVKGTKEPIEVAKGSVEKIQKKIIACAKVLTSQDELSAELTALLEDLDVEIPTDDDDAGKSSPAADFPSKDEVSKMKTAELKELNKSKNLKVKTTGVKVKDLRDLIWEAISKLSGDDSGLPDEDALDDMDFDDLEDLVGSNDVLSDEIDMDDFDEDEDDDEDALRSAILKVIAGLEKKKPAKEKDAGTPDIDFPEVDEDDPDEAHAALAAIVKDQDLDIDPEDFDEDEEDEVNDFLGQVKAAVKAKAPAADDDNDDNDDDADDDDAVKVPELPDADDIEDDAEEVHSALTAIVNALGLDIDPEDFDEDEEDEVLAFHKKVAKALKKAAKKGGKGKGKDKADKKKKEPETPAIITDIKENSDDFKALKKLVKGDDIFAKLAGKVKDFKKDPEKLAKKMLKIAEKNAGTPAKKEKTGKKKPSTKGPGVIGSIVACIENAPCTREDILEELTELFPDKDPKAMMKTIKVQVPSRIRKEKNSTLKEKDGKYFFKKEENGVKATKK